MKYDVFISYSSHDQKVVEGLCAYLEQHKIRCFVAYRDIPKSKVWAQAIVEALDASRMMVVVFSENFNHSEQVDREIELASDDKKPILTFRISDTQFSGAKKYYLKKNNS
ncbi:MAG: toll/interleukin-1 receptor domain-containing protein, partial [Rikenellaceae bacterium]|nr:toll/interleukin-1 receptor domain-containing protein [Rikenellaceae bacterium]